jgi:peptidoglycan hydrolase-like protein with peptidoglycan-binding domain
MNGGLNFEAMPFEVYETVAPEQGGFESEEEFGRGARSRSRPRGFAPRVMPKRPGPPPVFRPGTRKKPPVYPPRFPRFPPRWPWRPVGGYGVVPEPYPAEPLPAGSEYMRWVQSALNDVLGLRLPVNGIADSATRSAIRTFQQRAGLPADGTVGPDTERALIAARGGTSPAAGVATPPEPDTGQSGPAMSEPAEPAPAAPAQPASAAPAEEVGFEWETFGQEFGDTQTIAERAAVKSRVAAGQRDPNALTDMVFFKRHPELGGRRLRADERQLAGEWKAILRDIVLPELARGRAGPAAGTKVGDRDVAAVRAMAARKFPELGISLEQLLVRHQAEADGIPIEVLLAFIRYEAGTRLNCDATAGYWVKDKNKKPVRYVPSPKFYELGIFQTPAGLHGCIPKADNPVEKSCAYPRPPGHNVQNSSFGKGWYRLTRTYPTEKDWTNPTMQVRIGLWNLTSPANRIRNDKEFTALFPSKQSEWYLRMAVLYSFAAGAGWTVAFLRKYKNQLLALPEGQRWGFLSGKQASRINPETKRVETKTFNPENVNEKMTLAAKLRAVRGATVTQSPGGMP